MKAVIDIEVIDRFTSDVDVLLIEQAALAALEAEGQNQLLTVSIIINADSDMQRLNREFRGIDATTDVLSFANDGDEDEPFVLPPDLPAHLGDIAISYERVLAQAQEYGHSVERELAFLTVHGILHLLGYDQERGPEDQAAMRAREEAIMQAMGMLR